ncbi:glycogen synthase [bacterium]|nr:glycogen synthase [bacterium]MBU1993676.1 glycogen synthase [bacterium]
MNIEKKQQVLFVSSEVYPFAKSGGLADVSYGFPRAMSPFFDVEIIMPMYKSIDKKKFGIKPIKLSFKIELGKKKYEVELFATIYNGMKCYFVESKILSNKKYLYGTPESGYKDNDLRFGLFSKAVVEFSKQHKKYDLLHLNDWQSALCALFVKEDASLQTKTLYTIHNMAYQGVFGKETLDKLGLSSAYFDMDALEYYGDINYMKAGIVYADAITTVSPNYAKEILTPEFGCGLDGFLVKHQNKLVGILNGLDLSHFSPASDSALVQNYDTQNYDKKLNNKIAYLKETGLENDALALFVFVGRFTWQKGIEMLVEALDALENQNFNIAILGDGESKYKQQIKEISKKRKNINLFFGYDEELSHRMYGSADFLIMPSLFEPCGLNQLIAMNYGTLPIVSSVGGLKDSVYSLSDFGLNDGYGLGICFDVKTPHALQDAMQKALDLYEEKEKFKEINQHNMQCDFSWKHGSHAYASLYNYLLDSME